MPEFGATVCFTFRIKARNKKEAIKLLKSLNVGTVTSNFNQTNNLKLISEKEEWDYPWQVERPVQPAYTQRSNPPSTNQPRETGRPSTRTPRIGRMVRDSVERLYSIEISEDSLPTRLSEGR
jgi:hypothetical protein